MAKKVMVPKEVAQAVEEGFDELLQQTPPVISKEALIKRCLPKITELLDRGWPIAALAEVLNKHGVEIAETTLATYIQRQIREKKAAAETGGDQDTAPENASNLPEGLSDEQAETGEATESI